MRTLQWQELWLSSDRQKESLGKKIKKGGKKGIVLLLNSQ